MTMKSTKAWVFLVKNPEGKRLAIVRIGFSNKDEARDSAKRQIVERPGYEMEDEAIEALMFG